MSEPMPPESGRISFCSLCCSNVAPRVDMWTCFIRARLDFQGHFQCQPLSASHSASRNRARLLRGIRRLAVRHAQQQGEQHQVAKQPAQHSQTH